MDGTVAYTHAHNMIHRDLKPDNVMAGPFGKMQVMDRGLAKVIGRQATWRGESVSTGGKAQSFHLVGTGANSGDPGGLLSARSGNGAVPARCEYQVLPAVSASRNCIGRYGNGSPSTRGCFWLGNRLKRRIQSMSACSVRMESCNQRALAATGSSRRGGGTGLSGKNFLARERDD
jgi:serine/threonine protein kinase